jgi:hypothetical protein
MTTEAELAALRQRSAQILLSGECSRIMFEFGSTTFRAGGYTVIGMSIGTAPAHPHGRGGRRQMGVRVARLRAHVGAEYHAATNEMVFPRASYGSSLVEEAAIVHEATHAICDYHRIRVSALEEEAIAYIADAMYTLMRNSAAASSDPIDTVALGIARDLVAPHRLMMPWTRTVTQTQQNQLIAAIRASPTYPHLNNRPHTRYQHDGGRV